MVFHLLMTGKGGVTILLNDREVEPWDPFLAGEPATAFYSQDLARDDTPPSIVMIVPVV